MWSGSEEDNPWGRSPAGGGATETPNQKGKGRGVALAQPRKRLETSRRLFTSESEPEEEIEEEEEEESSETNFPVISKQRKAKSVPKKATGTFVIPPKKNPQSVPRPVVVPKKTTALPPVPPPPTAPKQSAEEKAVREMAHAITDVVMRALQPMWDAVCGLAWKLGYRDARYFLVYRDAKTTDATDPFAYLRVIDEKDPKLTTMAYFVSKYSPILGQRFLTLFLAQYQKGEEKQARETLAKKPKTIDACFDVDVDLANLHAPHLHRQFNSSALAELKRQLQLYTSSIPPPAQVQGLDPVQVEEQIARLESGQEALKLLRLQETEARFAPAWAFQVLSDNVFRTFVAPAGLAAFEMALAHVRRIPGCSTFEMKELICSAEVKDQFMWLAAYQYLDASKGLPMDRPASGKGERNVYVNYNAMRETLQRRAYLCSIWFESVVATQNPLVEQFRKYRATLPGPLSQDELETLAMYEASLPQRELKYVGC